MFVVEEETKFSESLLWDLQKSAYMSFGPKAWSEKGVPFYMTSNAFTARAYARVLARQIEKSKRCFIFDLGAGCGKFAYVFVKSLLSFGIHPKKFCYVLCDMVQENLIFCKNHSKMQEIIDLDCVDFADFELYKSQELYLQRQGKVVSLAGEEIFLIANYFFDTVCQELYYVKDDTLFEGFVKILSNTEVQDPLDPRLIEYLEFEYSYKPSLKKPQELLGNKSFQGPFLYPKGAIDLLEFFSSAKYCLIAGDQGSYDLQPPKISKHASFSFPVSYFFIAQYFAKKEGLSLQTEFPDQDFVVYLGANFYDAEVKREFQEFISAFEPRDYWALVNSLEGQIEKLDLKALFMLLKLGNWDYNNFYLFAPRIAQLIVQASAKELEQWMLLFEKLWQNFYPVSEKEAVIPLNIAKWLYVLKRYDLAIYYLKECLKICPSSIMAQDLLDCIQKEKACQ